MSPARILCCYGGLRASVLWWCAYLAIAVVASWPLCWSITSAIPYGCEAEATVPLFNLWTLWWNSDRAAAGFRGYWDAPIFHPTRGTFAFSEAQPTMIVAAPVVWLTGSRALAYNVYQLAILTLNGWSGYYLLRRVGHGPWLAFCGGAMCELLPFVWWQLGVVQLSTLFGIIWTIHSLLDLFDEDRRASPTVEHDPAVGKTPGWALHAPVWLRLGAAFGLTYWLCNYWGLFLAVLVVPASIWFWNGRLRSLAFWREVVLAALVSGAMIGPIAYMQRALSAEHTWAREANLIADLSAHPRDYTDTPWTPLVPALEIPEAGRSNVWPLGVGGLKLLLAPIGLIVALATRGRRRWGLFVATLGLLAFGLSLGPTIRIASFIPGLAGASPYHWLQQCVPGFALIRSPFRFTLFAQLAAVWLSVEALALLHPCRWKRLFDSSYEEEQEGGSISQILAHRNWFNGLGLISLRLFFCSPMIAASYHIALEVLPARQKLYSCPSPRDVPVWVMWLRDNTSPDEAVACLPFPTGYTVGDYEKTTQWMYWATFHRRPLVNGYSGFFPKSFVSMKEDLEQYRKEPTEPGQPVPPQLKLYPFDNAGLSKLNASGAAYAIVPRAFATRDDVWAHPATKFRWAWVTGDETEQIDVYRIEPPLSE